MVTKKTNENAIVLKSMRTTPDHSPRRVFGLAENQYQALFLQQNKRCAICGNEEIARDVAGKSQRLIIYFNNQTGIVLGLLCRACSIGLHLFDDNPAKLARAIAFLTEQYNAGIIQGARAKLEDMSDGQGDG